MIMFDEDFYVKCVDASCGWRGTKSETAKAYFLPFGKVRILHCPKCLNNVALDFEMNEPVWPGASQDSILAIAHLP